MWLLLRATCKNFLWDPKCEQKKALVLEASAASQALISLRGVSSRFCICGRAGCQSGGFAELRICVCSPHTGWWVWKPFPGAAAACSSADSWVLLLGSFPQDGSGWRVTSFLLDTYPMAVLKSICQHLLA